MINVNWELMPVFINYVGISFDYKIVGFIHQPVFDASISKWFDIKANEVINEYGNEYTINGLELGKVTINHFFYIKPYVLSRY